MKTLKEWQAENNIKNIELAKTLNKTPVMISKYHNSKKYFVDNSGNLYKKLEKLN